MYVLCSILNLFREIPMAFQLPELPWPINALGAEMPESTLNYHYGKHHKAYVDNLNKFAAGSRFEELPLVDVIRMTAGDPAQKAIFNNAAQVWNHDFFWKSMKPNGGGAPSGKLAELIDRDLGGFEAFKETFAKTAVGQFGSGWGWLIFREGKLEVISTGNAETPISQNGVTPLLTVDVWEHAYYLDFQNRRPDFVANWLSKLANWEFAEAQLVAAL